MSDPLSKELQDFLLSIVDNPHSDYDDGLEGYPNYRIKDNVLKITFLDDDGDTFKGEWSLTHLSSELKFKEGGE